MSSPRRPAPTTSASRRGPALAAALLGATLVLLPDPAAAQLGGLGGLRKRVEQKVTETVTGKPAGPSLPEGFLDARYEITAVRLDGLVRGAVRATDEVARYERARAERKKASDEAEREMERANAEAERIAERAAQRFAQPGAMGSLATCQMEVHRGLEELPESDPRRKRGEAAMERWEKYMDELEQRERTGQRVDTIAAARRASALIDSVAIAVRGAPCRESAGDRAKMQRQGDAIRADAEAMRGASDRAMQARQRVPSAGPVVRPDVPAIVRGEAGLDKKQMGVVCDKLIAFIEATDRKQEIAGFTDAEKAALTARLAEVRKHRKTMCEGGEFIE